MNPRPTILDVAKLAGVSKSTVSRVLNNELDKVSSETQEKVLEAIRRLDFEQNLAATSLRTDRTNLVMLMIPDIMNPYWPEVARGIQDFMGEQNYSVVFANSDWTESREMEYLRVARRNRFDGLLINPVHVSEVELLALKIPIVVLGINEDYPRLDSVGSDNLAVNQKAIDYLIRLGHVRIGMLLGQSQRGSSRLRLEIYRQALIKNDLPLDERLIVPVTYDQQGGVQGMAQLLDREPVPTAVLASNDVIAMGAMQLAAERGYRIPADISIMGIDDIHSAQLTSPPLTTIRKQKYEIGRVAAASLLDRMQGRYAGEPRKTLVPCQLIVRGSTGQNRRT